MQVAFIRSPAKRLIVHLRAVEREPRKTEKFPVAIFNSILSNKAAVAFFVTFVLLFKRNNVNATKMALNAF